MDTDKEGILSTVTSAVVDTGAVVVDTAKAGFEGAKDLAVDTGAVVVDTAKAGFEGAKDLTVTAGTAVGEAVTAVAKKARKAVSRTRVPRNKTAKKGRVSRASATRRAPKKPARKSANPTRKVSRATVTRVGRKSTAKKPAPKSAKPRTATTTRRRASTKARSTKRGR